MSFQQYNVYSLLSPCRVVATANQAGTYFNGPLNNGVGATLTYATGVLTIDSVDIQIGDSVALVGQTNDNENGIYICIQLGAVGISAILERRHDMQCIEQIKAGMWTTIGAGTISAGSAFVVAEPLPQQFGIDDLILTAMIAAGSGTAGTKAASDNAQPTVASVVGATTTNALAVFADAAGSVKNQTVASTLAFGLTLTTGNLTISAGNIVVTAGTITASGNLSITAGTITASGNISSSAGLILQRAVNGLTALAGGAQAGTALTGQINRVTTVVTAADSVQLPAATAGKVITVINAAAANAMAVFPQTGEVINALAANASISVAADKTITFFCAIAGTWNSLLTA